MAQAGPAAQEDLLAPFVSRLALDWSRDSPDLRYRAVRGTLVFADISGFTKLTERLAAKGRFGAEEMSDILDSVLSSLLDAAYSYGGWLVKWGGDALLLMFDGDDDAARACAASAEMLAVMRDIGQLQTTVGRVRLRMSIGVHSGVVDFVFVGRRHRELLITGDAASETAAMETTADAGEVVISSATAEQLPAPCRGAAKGEGVLLAAVPTARKPGSGTAPEATAAMRELMPDLVMDHLTAGGGSGEHRQVAVAFVEFRGVGALQATRGPSAVVEAIERLVDVTQEAAHRYGVTFHETDIGPDGGKIMLVAGAPKALDNHAEAMLCTAREIVDDESPLAIRIGVTTGRVFTGSVGPSYRRSYSVKGDVVNMAARVMGKSLPGQIWAVEAVVPHSRTQFELEALPPFMVKGKTQPITAYAVGQPVGRAAADVELPLVGRGFELETLEVAVSEARGGSGQAIEVVADAGMGKTRLLAECRRIAAGVGVVGVISVAAEPFRSATPYALLRPLLTQALGLGAASPDVLSKRLATWCAAVAPQLQPWLPLLGTVFNVSLPDTPQTADLDEQFRKTRLEETVVEALSAALPGPSILLVDDGHYADEASLDVLRRIAEILPSRPWLLVIGRRDSDGADRAVVDGAVVDGAAVDGADVDGESAQRLVLGPLDAIAAEVLVHAETDNNPLSPHVADAVVRRGEGNPLFLRELAQAAAAGASAEDLPDSVENLVDTQIDRLAPRDRDVLRAASVIGVAVDPDLLIDVLRTYGDGSAEVDLQRLHGFLHRDGDVLRFRQTLVQHAAYEGMPYRRRTALHARLAGLLACGVGRSGDVTSLLSFHYFQAGMYADALTYARRAADNAAASYANVEAVTLYERALASARYVDDVGATEVAQLRESVGDMRCRLGEFTVADTAFAAARRLRGKDPVAVVGLALKSARGAEHLGKWSLALGRLKRAEQALAGRENEECRELRLRLLVRRAWIRYQQGRLTDARHACRAALDEADAQSAPGLVADALRLLDEVEIRLGIDKGDGSAERALQLYEEVGDLSGQARMLNGLGYRAYFDGRWTDALELYERSRLLLERIGDSWNVAVAAGNIAEVYADQGRLTEAEAMLRTALRVWRAASARDLVAFGECLLGRLLVRQGRYDDGWALIEQARDEFRDLGALSSAIDADAYAAECLLLRGRATEALSAARTALAEARTQSELPTSAPLLLRIAGGALDATGEIAAAGEAYAEALAIARRRTAAHEVAFTLAALVARAGRAGEAVDEGWVDEARRLHRELGLVLDLTMLEGDRRAPTLPAQRVAPVPAS
jgi:class 3 adenylate cyclase/tetratricopeptide (TPR) repeat protein